MAVVEMGANHVNEIAQLCSIAQPDFGLITNIGKAHIEGFGSFEGVVKTKNELYEYLRSHEGRIFVNYDNTLLRELSKDMTCFSYGSNRSERNPLFGSAPKKNPILYFGINSEDAVTNPDATEGGLIEDITGLVGGIGYASWADSSLNPRPINGEELNNFSGSYTSFTGTKNVVIENVDNGMRLGWIVSTNNTSSNTNGNYWLYLDDIKVQVASNN